MRHADLDLYSYGFGGRPLYAGEREALEARDFADALHAAARNLA